jgi:high-affinity Fe2+/Pb2+ permease
MLEKPSQGDYQKWDAEFERKQRVLKIIVGAIVGAIVAVVICALLYIGFYCTAQQSTGCWRGFIKILRVIFSFFGF